jgi:hypothetical protein
MTLPASSTIALSQVNTELNRTSTASINMDDTGLRALFEKTSSGGIISMSDGWGKSRATISYTGGSPMIIGLTGEVCIVFTIGGSVTFSGTRIPTRILVVGGGAGGDYRYNSGGGGGGGGGVAAATYTDLRGTYNFSVGGGGIGYGTTEAGATGGTSSFGSLLSATGGRPSGYSSGYNYGRGGTPNGANGGLIPNGAGSAGTTSDIMGSNYVFGSGGGAGGTSGGAGGEGAGNGGYTNQEGRPATNYGAGGGGGGFYNGSTYYYGGRGYSGCVIVRGAYQ